MRRGLSETDQSARDETSKNRCRRVVLGVFLEVPGQPISVSHGSLVTLAMVNRVKLVSALGP